MKTTKRRKVWVNLYSWGAGGSCETKAAALRKFQGSMTYKGDRAAVPFLERLPGDVVLSRKTTQRINDVLKMLEGAPLAGTSMDVLVKNSVKEIRTLVRSRR